MHAIELVRCRFSAFNEETVKRLAITRKFRWNEPQIEVWLLATFFRIAFVAALNMTVKQEPEHCGGNVWS
jgi:hypothetical protein